MRLLAKVTQQNQEANSHSLFGGHALNHFTGKQRAGNINSNTFRSQAGDTNYKDIKWRVKRGGKTESTVCPPYPQFYIHGFNQPQNEISMAVG